MLLRVRALAAVSEQTRRDFASDERLKKGGEGEEEDERGKQTVAPVPGSHLASARRRRRRRRPDDCHLKPGLRFEASQRCAGKSAAAAQLVNASLLVKRRWGWGRGSGSTVERCDSFYVNSACDGLQRPRRGC